MTRAGNLITIDTNEAQGLIGQLLREVEESGQHIQILREGRVVAEIRPARRTIDPLRQHPELMGIKFTTNPAAPLDDEDWPKQLS